MKKLKKCLALCPAPGYHLTEKKIKRHQEVGIESGSGSRLFSESEFKAGVLAIKIKNSRKNFLPKKRYIFLS
jgi:hypothetical protein